jgi:hypothetical protein
MGGINSGRRPDLWEQRPQVEDALIIDLPLLRAYDALTSGTHGVLHWISSKSECAFQTHGDELTLEYAVKGCAYRQSIRLAAIALWWNNGTSRPCLLCSQCGCRVYKLYLSHRQGILEANRLSSECETDRPPVAAARAWCTSYRQHTMAGSAMRSYEA